MPFELISAMVEDGMGTWLRADPVGRLLWAQPARRRGAAASARRRAEFMEDPRAAGLAVRSCADLSEPNTAEPRPLPGATTLVACKSAQTAHEGHKGKRIV